MATLRRRKSDESAGVPESEETVQSSLGLEDSVAGTDTGSEDTADEQAPVKKRRVVKVKTEAEEAPSQQSTQTEETEAQETASTENTSSEEHGYRRNPNQHYNNKRGPMNNKRPYAPRNYPTPSGEVSEAIAQDAGSTEDNANKPRLLINDLTIKSMPELRDMAMQYGFTADDLAPMKKQDLIFVILKAHTEHGGIIFASGALEILPDGYGFLRSPQNSYLPGPDDIYISPSQIRLFNLKTGDTVYGQTRSP